MKTINKIVVFNDDKYLLAQLSRYGYANGISVMSFDFTIDAILEAVKIKPLLVIVPLDWLTAANKRYETILLKQAHVMDQIKICASNKNSSPMISKSSLTWIDLIISDPFNIDEIDKFLKTTFQLNKRSIKKSSRSEQPPFIDKRTVNSAT